jgi:uncharacterized protein
MFKTGTSNLVIATLLGLLCGVLLIAAAQAQTKFDAACSLEQPNDFERRICENATIHELDRKLGRLKEELQRGWHVDGEASYEQSEKWRATTRATCHDDTCQENTFRQRLTLLNGFPAFSCSRKLSRVERLICRSPKLGFLDRSLNYEYGVALDLSHSMLGLQAAQVLWLRKTRDACKSSKCLNHVYRQRIHFLLRSQAISRARFERESKSNVFDARDLGVKLKPRVSKAEKAQRLLLPKYCPEHPDPIDWLDLNRDGHTDPVLSTCYGAHNEEVYFYLWEKNHYRLILENSVGYFGYSLQDTRIRGFPVLRLITHGSCCEHPSTYFAYNGQEYKQVALFDEYYVREDFFTFLPALNN